MRSLFIALMTVVVVIIVLGACQRATPASPTPLSPLDPDNEPDAMTAEALVQALGPVRRARTPYEVGVVLKFLGNQYWQLLAEGVQDRAMVLNVRVDVRAAATENDPEGQRVMMAEMLAQGYDAFIISPQTDDNLSELVAQAQAQGLPVVVVNEVVRDARHWVGPNQYESGALAAEYIKAHLEGGKVAVIEGLPGAYAARQRTLGFKESLQGTDLEVVASVPANWDSQQALRAAQNIIRTHPDIRGFYCNNDIMAMGVLAAGRVTTRLESLVVIGTDGIEPAYAAIQANALSATVDTFPYTTGEVALEVTLRLLEGQTVPRVVYSPQQLMTRDSLGITLP
jgi:ribose transport system substrate-binding protein